MRTLLRTIRRLFTHPYGPCREEGCDSPRMRWFNYCQRHQMEVYAEAGRKIAQREFDRQADIVAEGIRRARNG